MQEIIFKEEAQNRKFAGGKILHVSDRDYDPCKSHLEIGYTTASQMSGVWLTPYKDTSFLIVSYLSFLNCEMKFLNEGEGVMRRAKHSFANIPFYYLNRFMTINSYF